jgi:hypothetical protein
MPEKRTLAARFADYADHTARVRCRLVPLIQWPLPLRDPVVYLAQ